MSAVERFVEMLNADECIRLYLVEFPFPPHRVEIAFSFVALGGVNKKLDTKLYTWLQKSPLILLSLDFDDVGKKHYSF